MINHRLSDPIKIEELLEITQLLPIISIIKSKVLKLCGYINSSKSGLSKIFLDGIIGIRS